MLNEPIIQLILIPVCLNTSSFQWRRLAGRLHAAIYAVVLYCLARIDPLVVHVNRCRKICARKSRLAMYLTTILHAAFFSSSTGALV